MFGEAPRCGLPYNRVVVEGERVRVPFALSGMQWSHWMLKDDDLGTAVTRTEHKNDSAVEIGPGGRVAKFEFVGLWGRNPMGTMVRIEFGTGGRAPVRSAPERSA